MSRALEPGSSISHYRVVSALGSGGMGEVYKAQDTTLGRVVALKILPPELTRNTDRVRRFVQEAKTASSLNHPHIVTIHEIGQATASTAADAPPLHYIAMEMIDGLTLREKIHGDKTDLKTLLVYMGQVAEGMAKAHAAGIIHRDLKPDNVMITRDGYAKVLDFGLAKLNIRKGADAESSGTTETQQVTREGAVMGTVAYMSPEQVQGKVIDYRSDIFSFGCMLYEAATRRRPFEADSDMDVMYKIVHDAPPNIEEIDPTVPVELRHLIRRCVAKDPDKRFQWMKDVALELNDIVAEFDQLPTSVPSRTSPSISTPSAVIRAMPRRVAWTMLATGAAIVIAIIAAGVFLWKRAETATESAARARPMRMDRVTNSGDVSSACISGDGRYLAYTARDENLESRLIVRQVATGVDVTLVGPIREAILTPVG